MVGKKTSLTILAAGLAAFSLVGALAAEDAPPDTNNGRYTFSKQPDGFVRLDSQTGEVALCSRKAVGFACETAPEDRAVLENEIARLHGENAALKKDLLSRGLALPSGATPEPLAQDGGRSSDLRLPRAADIDRVVALAGRVWRRLIDAVERAQKQILNRS
jgi:hypothetical protein